MHFVPRGGFGKENSAVWRNIKVVGQPQATVINNRRQAAIGLIGNEGNDTVFGNAIKTHPANAHIKSFVLIEGKPQSLPANTGKDFPFGIIGRKKADDFPMTRSAIQIVVFIKDDILWSLNLI